MRRQVLVYYIKKANPMDVKVLDLSVEDKKHSSVIYLLVAARKAAQRILTSLSGPYRLKHDEFAIVGRHVP